MENDNKVIGTLIEGVYNIYRKMMSELIDISRCNNSMAYLSQKSSEIGDIVQI